MERNSEWHAALAASGADFDGSGLVRNFGSPVEEAEVAQQSAVLVPLLDTGLIRVSGADAAAFLNSQLTSDIAAVSAQSAQYTGYCTPKGRLLATMLVFLDGENYWLVLPDEIAEPVAGMLRRYVLRAKVDLQAANGDLILFGVTGPHSATVLTDTLTAPRSQLFALTRHHGAVLITLPHNRYLVACKADQAGATWRTLTERLRPAGSICWQLHTIRSGIATVTSATQEAFIPQMLALDAYGGVSFEKGCYPGQEIVARTHYLGALKRRLYYGRCKQALVPGDAIVDASDAKTVGTVVNAAVDAEAGSELLAVVQRDAVDAHLKLQSRSGSPLDIVAPATDMLAGGSS